MGGAEQLRDIRGLDPIGIWPLAPGWWLSALALVLLCYGLYRLYRATRLAPWAGAARYQIKQFKQRFDQGELIPNREILVLLRQVALAGHARQEVAALQGEDWLAWLQVNDPKGFDWSVYRQELVEQQYRPTAPEPWDPERGIAVLAAIQSWTRGARV